MTAHALEVLRTALKQTRVSAEAWRATEEHQTELAFEARTKRRKYEAKARELEHAIDELGGAVEEVTA